MHLSPNYEAPKASGFSVYTVYYNQATSLTRVILNITKCKANECRLYQLFGLRCFILLNENNFPPQGNILRTMIHTRYSMPAAPGMRYPKAEKFSASDTPASKLTKTPTNTALTQQPSKTQSRQRISTLYARKIHYMFALHTILKKIIEDKLNPNETVLKQIQAVYLANEADKNAGRVQFSEIWKKPSVETAELLLKKVEKERSWPQKPEEEGPLLKELDLLMNYVNCANPEFRTIKKRIQEMITNRKMNDIQNLRELYDRYLSQDKFLNKVIPSPRDYSHIVQKIKAQDNIMLDDLACAFYFKRLRGAVAKHKLEQMDEALKNQYPKAVEKFKTDIKALTAIDRFFFPKPEDMETGFQVVNQD